MMNMNMFGFTHSGADACGSIDLNDTTTMDEELCLRWIQLSTFFPLARHYQDFKKKDSYVTGPLGFTDETKKQQVWMSMRDRM
jgi:alpha-glucosidase (family GH31 glycosyl hydrolase)